MITPFFIYFLAIMIFVCILFAAWIALTENGRDLDDHFRRRWGGSDAKQSDDDTGE